MMRKAPLIVLGTVLMLLLVVASLFIGALRGYQQEKAQVESTLGSLETVFSSRVETGNNILTVAERHLPREDALITAVKQDLQALTSNSPFPERAKANDSLEQNARALLSALQGTASVQADSRDLGYVTGLLPQALDQSAQWSDARYYNEAAEAFNNRLSGSFAGTLAMLLGQKPVQPYTP